VVSLIKQLLNPVAFSAKHLKHLQKYYFKMNVFLPKGIAPFKIYQNLTLIKIVFLKGIKHK
jgi:hypothetical protein